MYNILNYIMKLYNIYNILRKINTRLSFKKYEIIKFRFSKKKKKNIYKRLCGLATKKKNFV
jgi:hypothetical protein